MEDGSREPLECFVTWLLRRLVQAVEDGEVPADLLTEFQAEIEAARDRSGGESHVEAVRDIAEKLGIPEEEVERGLAAIEAQPTVTRELLMRRIAEAWLDTQRTAFRSRAD